MNPDERFHVANITGTCIMFFSFRGIFVYLYKNAPKTKKNMIQVPVANIDSCLIKVLPEC